MMLSFLLTLALISASPSPSPCGTPDNGSLSQVTVKTPVTKMTLEIAATETQRERGLMNRRSMPARHGMLFIFDRDAPVEFWMKDTLIPLDMVFLSAGGTVRSIANNVHTVPPNTPDAQIPRVGGRAKFVIELNANEARADGIVPGVRLHVPNGALVQTATVDPSIDTCI